MAPRDSLRMYGSIRIQRDGRVSFSPWTFSGMHHLSFLVDSRLIRVRLRGQRVMEMDVKRGRVWASNFSFILTPEQLREAVSTLRRAGNGIERWIVPALEYSSWAGFRDDHPATFAIVPELLESCKDLPVADRWKRVRATILDRYEKLWAKKDAEKAASGKREERPAPKPKRPPAKWRRRARVIYEG